MWVALKSSLGVCYKVKHTLSQNLANPLLGTHPYPSTYYFPPNVVHIRNYLRKHVTLQVTIVVHHVMKYYSAVKMNSHMPWAERTVFLNLEGRDLANVHKSRPEVMEAGEEAKRRLEKKGLTKRLGRTLLTGSDLF